MKITAEQLYQIVMTSKQKLDPEEDVDEYAQVSKRDIELLEAVAAGVTRHFNTGTEAK